MAMSDVLEEIRGPVELHEGEEVILHVLYTEGWVCDVALIKCTLSPGKSKRGWDFGREGTMGQWGTKELVYEQPGTEVDDSYHNWRVPSK